MIAFFYFQSRAIFNFKRPLHNNFFWIFKEFSTDECGKSYICEKSPPDCTTTENCETLVMYKQDKQADTLDVILSTNSPHAYIGWAQNDKNQKMVGR